MVYQGGVKLVGVYQVHLGRYQKQVRGGHGTDIEMLSDELRQGHIVCGFVWPINPLVFLMLLNNLQIEFKPPSSSSVITQKRHTSGTPNYCKHAVIWRCNC